MNIVSLAGSAFRIVARLLRGEDPFVRVRTKDEWERDYREHRWDQLVRDYRSMGSMAVVTHLLSSATDASHRRLLDVGCGNGALLAGLDLLARKFEYVGADVSSEALAQLRARHPQAATVCADMADVSALPGAFDVIVFSESLYYADCASVLKSYRDKLAPGGLVIVSMHERASRRILWARIASIMTELQSFTIADDASGTAWTVKLLRYADAGS
jgi:SAM-dependent methyltransferase